MENGKNGNVKWMQFWAIISVIILAMVGYIYANDRVRACEDLRLEDKWGVKLDKILDKTSSIEANISGFTKQIAINTQRLDRLEGKYIR